MLATYRFVLQPVQIGFNNIWEKESIILSSKVNYIWNVLEILINKQIIEPLYMQGPNPLGPIVISLLYIIKGKLSEKEKEIQLLRQRDSMNTDAIASLSDKMTKMMQEIEQLKRTR